MNDSETPDESRLPSNTQPDAGGSRRRSAKRGRPRRFGFYFKWTAISIILLMGVAVGTVFGYFYTHSKLFHTFFTPNNMVAAVTGGDLFAAYQPDKQFPGQHTMNVLVLGCDSDYVEHVDHPIVVKGAPGRSDAIMVAHIDFDKKTVNVLSIPRDTAVPIPGQRGFHKVNAAHTFGGNELSARTVSEDFGIPIDHTISLDFDSFQQVVDKVGGVDVTIHKNLDYDDNWGNLHVHLKPGLQHLNGYQAMGYVRIRHSDSDLARAERQHEFLEALRARVKDPRNFFSLPGAVNAITDDIKSDLTLDQMLTLVHFATPLPKDNIHLATMEGFEGRSYVYAYPDKAQEIIGKMFFDGNSTAVKLNVASRETVLVLNNHGRRVRTSRSHRRRSRSGESAGHHTLRPAVQDGAGTPPATEATDKTMPENDAQHGPNTDGPGAGNGATQDGRGASGKIDDGVRQANIPLRRGRPA